MKALTGNLLGDGEAVFWREGQWVPRFVDAQLFDDDAVAEAAEAHAKSELTIVVVSAPGCEPAAITLTAPEGTVLFYSMATRFQTAASDWPVSLA